MEMLYHYLWKHRMMRKGITTTDGRGLNVISPGVHNRDAGPDFSGARVRIGSEEWAGNVEIHVRASDWFRHHHDSDPAYSNVILHVVGFDDARIPDGRGGYIPQLHVTFPDTFARLYMRLSEKLSAVECEDMLGDLSPLVVTTWLDALAVERMQQKAQRILDTVALLDGDWERACFVTLARSLGFSLNAEPLEMMARSLPLAVLAKHSDDLTQIEALMFGQAGMLDSTVMLFDDYYQTLCREYLFLARKYGLKPMRRDLWKYATTRPQNFPTRRVALLARAVYGGFSLLSRILDPSCRSESAADLFGWQIDGYWADHRDFGVTATRQGAALSPANVSLLMINLVAPMLYAYGASHGDCDMAERGLDIWRDLRAENNSVIRQWRNAGMACDTAMDSQALLQLRKQYCDRNRCLDCRFGHALLRAKLT